MSEARLDHELELVDSINPGGELIASLFGVFSCHESNPDSQRPTAPGERRSTRNEDDEAQRSWLTPALAGFLGSSPYQTPNLSNSSPVGYTRSSVQICSTATPYDRSLSDSELQHELLQCWTTRLSSLMTPIPQRDNIFTNIITPLALQALAEHSQSTAHLALLHALLAMTAFWRENVSSTDERDLGRKYLDSSLSFLNRCLRDPKHHHVILAAISTLLVIPAFVGEDSAWRVHIRGGIAWVQSVDASIWNRSDTSVALLQLFGFYEALSPASGWIGCSNVGSPTLLALELDFGSDAQWCLDAVLGITRSITHCIRQINLFLYSTPPTRQDLDELELNIYRSDPTGRSVPGLDVDCSELAQQHARLYYYATHLYFSRGLKQVTVAKVQHFVRSSLDPIRRIHALEERHDVSGILWPYFIVGCEALETESRLMIMRYLDHRESQGVANSGAARRAILTVWNERDKSGQSELSWIEIMAREGIDLLLL